MGIWCIFINNAVIACHLSIQVKPHLDKEAFIIKNPGLNSFPYKGSMQNLSL
jgi:hypothetical protein